MTRVRSGLPLVLLLAACGGAEVEGGEEAGPEGVTAGSGSTSGGGKTSAAAGTGASTGSRPSTASTTSAASSGASSSAASASTASASTGSRPSNVSSAASTTSAASTSAAVSTAATSSASAVSTAASTAASTSGGTGCGSLDFLGECQGTLLRWCESNAVRTVECADTDQLCAWESDQIGYNCVDAESSTASASTSASVSSISSASSSASSSGSVDPCNGVTFEGECAGTLLTWCENDALNSFECADNAQQCGWDDTIPGYNCVEDPCQGVTYEGECQGTLLRYCADNQLTEYDCAPDAVCDYDESITGYNCISTGGSTSSSSSSSSGGGGGCDGLDYLGECQGNLLRWCEGDALQEVNCTDSGRICQWENADIGYNCVNDVVTGGGFGYPVGDQTTYPAGGWSVTQILGHYWSDYGGVHLAEDISNGEANTALAPVSSVADGEVLYAGSNSSSYRNVVLIRHDLGNGEQVCSFYGHLEPPNVSSGTWVTRGQQVARVLDWVAEFGSANSHLHYVLLSLDLCLASDGANGALICGYDHGSGTGLDWTDLAGEPETYTAVGDICGDHNYPDAFIAPSKFIRDHHF